MVHTLQRRVQDYYAWIVLFTNNSGTHTTEACTTFVIRGVLNCYGEEGRVSYREGRIRYREGRISYKEGRISYRE